MKKLLLITVLLCCGCTGKTFDLTSGDSLSWDDQRGQWVVINYWAVWCKPCIEEIPELNKLAAENSATVLGVNYDGGSVTQNTSQASKLGIEFPVLINDPSQDLGYQRPSVLPTTLIFDQQGTLVKTLVGPQTLESLKLHLKER